MTALLLLTFALALQLITSPVTAYSAYDNQFIDPNFLVNETLWDPSTQGSAAEIVATAQSLALLAPWYVTDKTILPPSGDPRDYLSFPPYAWPDCSKVGNKTALTQQQIWTECPYVTRDGQFNPDQFAVNNSAQFFAIADTVFYNAIAWRINGSSTFSSNIVTTLSAWFLDPTRAMNPNLNYAQLLRGPGKQTGTHTGLLDLRGMAKIASAVLTLRLGNSAEWTSTIDAGFRAWVTSYIPWMTTNTLALQEKAADNNHGSFYFNQMVALYIIVDDTANAQTTIQEYFNGIYLGQIDASGEQPFEAARTHPCHYRSYNLAAMMTNARLAQYVGIDAWHLNTTKGGNIKAAVDFAMAVNISTCEAGFSDELQPIVAAARAVYGDPTGSYAAYLQAANVTEPFFFWETPDLAGIVNGTETAPLPSQTSGLIPFGTKSPSSSNGAITSTCTTALLSGVLMSAVMVANFVI